MSDINVNFENNTINSVINPVSVSVSISSGSDISVSLTNSDSISVSLGNNNISVSFTGLDASLFCQKSIYDTDNDGQVEKADEADSVISLSGHNATDLDDITSSGSGSIITADERAKLSGIEEGAEVNNISDANAADLTDGGETILHTHPVNYRKNFLLMGV